MLLFRRIFNFEKAKVAEMDHRLNTRYTPGAAFPLRAHLRLIRSEWKPVKIQNISGNGIGLLAAPDSKAEAGQAVKVKLVLGEQQLELDGRLAHFVPDDQGVLCGIGLKFGDFPRQKAYLQLLQPIAIGQSLQAVPANGKAVSQWSSKDDAWVAVVGELQRLIDSLARG